MPVNVRIWESAYRAPLVGIGTIEVHDPKPVHVPCRNRMMSQVCPELRPVHGCVMSVAARERAAERLIPVSIIKWCTAARAPTLVRPDVVAMRRNPYACTLLRSAVFAYRLAPFLCWRWWWCSLHTALFTCGPCVGWCAAVVVQAASNASLIYVVAVFGARARIGPAVVVQPALLRYFPCCRCALVRAWVPCGAWLRPIDSIAVLRVTGTLRTARVSVAARLTPTDASHCVWFFRPLRLLVWRFVIGRFLASPTRHHSSF